MKIKTVKYERLFPVGMYLNEKIGFEASIEFEMGTHPNNPLEHPIQAIAELRHLAEQIHKENYPHLYNESGLPETKFMVKDEYGQNPDLQKQDKIQSFINTIQLCNTTANLERFRATVERENNEALTTAFQNKLQSLQNQ